jgi:hypothetical protein
MVMQGIAIILLVAVAYIWSARGFLSALLNTGVVLASGAIALGAYEAVGKLLTGLSDGAMVQQTGWGAALVGTFAITAAVLSAIVNATVRWNAKVTPAIDWVGGAVCGLIAGVVVAGITVMGVTKTRLAPNFFDYRGVEVDNGGSPVRNSLWVPVDEWTAKLYGLASVGTLSTDTPLAQVRPHIAHEGHLQRLAPAEMLFKYSVSEKDVSLVSRFTVAASAGQDVQTLVGDVKPVKMLNGETMSGLAYIEGYVVRFDAGAREKLGQVVVGPGSATLVLVNQALDDALYLQPISTISQARGDTRRMGRWRFDTRDMFIGSAGGESSPTFALEFLVPKDSNGWVPTHLYVRGVRFDLVNASGVLMSDTQIASAGERDKRVNDGSLLGATAVKLATPGKERRVDLGSATSPVRTSTMLPDGIVLDATQLRNTSLSAGRQIMEADLTLTNKEIGGQIERDMRVSEFSPGTGTAIFTLDVSAASPFSLIGEDASGATGAPSLVDELGQRYDAIGYVYRTRENTQIVFKPGRPVRSLDAIPTLSKSRDDQKLFLLFRVSAGVKIKTYAIGDRGITQFVPMVVVNDQPGR